MRVMCHQPHFFPELYLWNRMFSVDKIVILDTVQFNNRSQQKKTPLLMYGRKYWFAVPVSHKTGIRISINEIEVLPGWTNDLIVKLHHAYSKARYYASVHKCMVDILLRDYTHLVNVNMHSIKATIELMNQPVRDRFLYLNELNLDKERYQKSDLILEICKTVGATEYLCGSVSVLGDENEKPYMDLAKFKKAGIQVVVQDWKPAEYPQVGKGEFIPNLSIIDLLYNVGFENAHEYLKDEQVKYL